MGRSMLIRIMLILLALECATAATSWASEDDGLAFHGRYQLELSTVGVKGNALAYFIDSALVPGSHFNQGLSFSAFGPLGLGWQLQGHFDSQLPPAERLSIAINKGRNELLAGTHLFETNGVGLLQLERCLTGVQGYVNTNPQRGVSLSGAYGEPVGLPFREELPGRGVTGPYLLNYYRLPIVPHSETVKIDEAPVLRGVDYQIDYDTGVITFREPVLETALITIEYEYVSEVSRRIALVAGHWRTGSVNFDVIVGSEHTKDENPLVFIPPDSQDPSDDVPEYQRMYGAGISWQPRPEMMLFASWLSTSSQEEETDAEYIPAWQVGGEWQNERGTAGFDYLVTPSGWSAPGRVLTTIGYRRLSAGYEQHLGGPWYSRLNTLWRSEDAKASEAGTIREKAEHVLTYVLDNTLLGWNVGLDGGSGLDGVWRQYTSGLLLTQRIGAWEMTAEHRGVLAQYGVPKPGVLLAQTKLATSLASKTPLNLHMSWQQQRWAPGENRPQQAVDWRLDAGRVTSSSGWRLLWRESETYRDGTSSARTSFIRGQVNMPLFLPYLEGSVILEGQNRQQNIGSSRYHKVKAAVEYQPPQGINWDVFASSGKLATATNYEEGYGGTIRIPLVGGWSYRAGWYQFAERGEEATRSQQVIHGLRWANVGWQVDGSLIRGLLEQPINDPNSATENVPLEALPQGHRLALSIQRRIGNSSLAITNEYSWEAEATSGRTRWLATHQVNQFNLEAEVAYSFRNALSGNIDTRQQVRTTVGWQLGERSSFDLHARYDARYPSSNSTYSGTAIFGQWTHYF